MSKGKPLFFPFYYGQEVEQYTFYRVPKVLFTEDIFQTISTDAKLLYGILLDRMQLSMQNQWFDEKGRVYIYFTIESVMEAFCCGNKKAGQLLAELDDKKGIGLITRTRQGQGRPDKIFIHKCVSSEMSIGQFQRCQKDISRNDKMTGLEMSKGHTNKTDRNNTEFNETESILSYPIGKTDEEKDGIKDYEVYREYFFKQLCMEALLIDYPVETEVLHEIVELLVETVCSGKEYIRIGGEDKPAKVVKSRLMNLRGEHIRYVLHCMKETKVKVRNIKQYLLASLYNAPLTMNNYYSALVNHDLYGKDE